MKPIAKLAAWTPQNVFGLGSFIAGIVVFYLHDSPDIGGLDAAAIASVLHESQRYSKLALALVAFGGALLGWSPSLPGIKLFAGDSPPNAGDSDNEPRTPPKPKGNPRMGLVVGALAAVLAMLAPACGPIQIRTDEPPTFGRRPGTDCYFRVDVKGETVIEVESDPAHPFTCVPPPEFCQPGPGEPGGPP